MLWWAMVTFIVPWWVIEYTGTESAHIPCSHPGKGTHTGYCSHVTLHPRSHENRSRMPMGSTLVSSEQAVCSATSPFLGEDKPEKKYHGVCEKAKQNKAHCDCIKSKDVFSKSRRCLPLNKSMIQEKAVLNVMPPSVEKFVLLCLY